MGSATTTLLVGSAHSTVGVTSGQSPTPMEMEVRSQETLQLHFLNRFFPSIRGSCDFEPHLSKSWL